MISFKQALSIIQDSAFQLEKEYVPLHNALRRVLCSDVCSDMDMPPFNKSAMDGYACRSIDRDGPLRVIETIPAGYFPKKTIGPHECAKIMTGGVVPEGADIVVMVEHTKTVNDSVSLLQQSSAKNICLKAEDVKNGDRILKKGTLLTPSEIAMLASVGCYSVPVARTPVIGIIATGNELVEPSSKPDQAQIRNSNSYQLYAQVLETGCQPLYFGIVDDTPKSLQTVIDRKIDKVDIFLFTGGVSMGDYDYVPDVLVERGFELLFRKVAIKPGKPNVFGKKGNTFVFGLPGNPVSTLMSFELLVKPLCFLLMGAEYKPHRVGGILSNAFKRKKSDRVAHIPVWIDEEGNVTRIRYHGSGHIHAFGAANGFITVPIGVTECRVGETVTVTLIK